MTNTWKQPQLTDPPMGPTDEIKLLQHRLLHAYPKFSLAPQLGVTESGIFDAATDQALRNEQAHIGGAVNAQPGVLTYATKLALGVYKPPDPAPPQPRGVFFSINGAGSWWGMGYPYDIGETLDKGKVYHQPIGYDTSPVPMMRGVATGVTEMIRQLDMPRPYMGGRNCTTLPWSACAYSMGAIVFMIVLMRVLFGDLSRFKSTYWGSSAFGNPLRQHGHTFPGCSYSDGEGIVVPTPVHDTPDNHWDFACDKAMANSPGDDLYTKINKAGWSTTKVSDMRSVWTIIGTGNPISLMLAVAKLLAMPSFSGDIAAAEAGFAALDFFVVKGVTPHTSYQNVCPIDGDPRTCWDIAQQRAVAFVDQLPVAA